MFDIVIGAIGLTASLLTFVSYFAPIKALSTKAWHASYVIIITAISGYLFFQASELKRIHDVAKSADELSSRREMNFTHRGYVMAALAFLEKNRDLYPEAYSRALEACEKFDCNGPREGTGMVELAFAFDGLIKGIGTLSKEVPKQTGGIRN